MLGFVTSGFTGSVTANIISGLVGADILTVLSGLVRWMIQKRTERQIPLKGQYLTSYEDREGDGQIIKRKATATLKQRGQHITGVTSNLDDSRSWNVDINLVRDRYLIGTYSSDDKADGSIGMIFLDRRGDTGELHGLWAGYDPHSNQIESGHYNFRRFTPPTIAILTPDRAREAMAILGRELGDQYVTDHDIMEYVTRPDALAETAINTDGRVMAVSISEMIDIEDFQGLFGQHLDAVRKVVPGFSLQTFGLFKSIAVSERYKGRGVGTILLRQALNWFEQQKATTIVSLAWESDGVCFAQGILESVGFERKLRLERFWYEDSTARGYQCPSCGNPCICTANIYFLTS